MRAGISYPELRKARSESLMASHFVPDLLQPRASRTALSRTAADIDERVFKGTLDTLHLRELQAEQCVQLLSPLLRG